MSRVFIIIISLMFALCSEASSKFKSAYSCQDSRRVCTDRGSTKMVEGFPIKRDCWEYSYTKTCNYPSLNNCRKYEHCYFVDNKECLLRDLLGNCVNQKKEFSCKRWEPRNKENQVVRMGLVEKEGPESLVCNGVPCIDGNCVDKSYMTNGEMMDSLSKLHATSNMKPNNNGNFNLFAGFSASCSKKATNYSNCCWVNHKGWGKEFGARCKKDEVELAEQRAKNLCVAVGSTKDKVAGVTVAVKHHFCCFGNMLEKVVQVEGRKQLGISFGSGGNTNCRGLTLEEIQRLDFSKIDFSEFINELLLKFTGSYKVPQPNEIASRIKSGVGNIRKYDEKQGNQANNMTGWSKKVGGDDE